MIPAGKVAVSITATMIPIIFPNEAFPSKNILLAITPVNMIGTLTAPFEDFPLLK